MSDTFQVLETASWKIDDKIITRDPFLKFATFDGEKFVGGLRRNDQLLPSLGYKVIYSGNPATLTQTGLPQFPVEDVVLRVGWNWIGHAPLHNFAVDSIEAVTPSLSSFNVSFDAGDQIKTRAGNVLKFITYTGGPNASWAGDIGQFTPGIGYEVKVAKALSFCYGTSCCLRP